MCLLQAEATVLSSWLPTAEAKVDFKWPLIFCKEIWGVFAMFLSKHETCYETDPWASDSVWFCRLRTIILCICLTSCTIGNAYLADERVLCADRKLHAGLSVCKAPHNLRWALDILSCNQLCCVTRFLVFAQEWGLSWVCSWGDAVLSWAHF